MHYIRTDTNLISFNPLLPTVAPSTILTLDIELYRGYQNTEFSSHDLLNISHNYNDFIIVEHIIVQQLYVIVQHRCCDAANPGSVKPIV